MRGADGYNESLFSTVRLNDFVPANHPLRPIRQWTNDALSKTDLRFSAIYEAEIKGGRPSIAPEKLMRAMLLQVLYSIRSERQLVEQISTTCCFTASSACPSRMRSGTTRYSARTATGSEHDAATELFNATVEVARSRGLLSGEHASASTAR